MNTNTHQSRHDQQLLQRAQELVRNADAFELSTEARTRLKCLCHFFEHGNAATTSRRFGIARSTLYGWLARADLHDPTTLEDRSSAPKNVPQPETDASVIELIRQYRRATPTLSKERISEQLSEEHGIRLSASSVGRVIQRHGFYFADTPLHQQKRKAAEQTSLGDSVAVTAVQDATATRAERLLRASTSAADNADASGRFTGLAAILLMTVASLVGLRHTVPTAYAASSFRPTVFVNTEAFLAIDDDDTTANVVLRFGDTLAKTITFDRSLDRFEFNDDVYVAGSLRVTTTISGAFVYATQSFSGAGLTDCSNGTTSKLLWNATTGRFSCGTDQVGGGSVTAGQGLTLTNTSFSLSSTISGSLARFTTLSGSYIHALNSITTSGGLVIDRTSNAEFIRLKDRTNNDSVSIRTGTGDPNGSVSAELGSLLFASDTGRLWKNNNGDTQWVELTTGSGTVHMAKMSRNAAQTISDTTWTKILFDAEEFDIGDIGDETSGDLFTIKRSGKYLITANMSLTLNNLDSIEVAIYKNGSIINSNSNYASGTAQSISVQVTTVLELAANDVIEMYVYHSFGSDRDTLTAVESKPRMSIAQLDGIVGATTSLWTDDGTSTYLTDLTDTVGIGKNTPKAKLDVLGTISGVTVYATKSFSGAGLTDCSNGTTSKLLWNATTGRFSCGTDTDTTTTYTAGQGLNLSASNAFSLKTTVTGSVIQAGNVLASSGSLSWKGAGSGQALTIGGGAVLFSATGSAVFNENSKPLDYRFEGDNDQNLVFLDASADSVGIGTVAPKAKLAVVGTISGATIYATRSFSGAGLTDCQNGTTSKLLWNATTGRFSCGTDTTTTYTAGQGLTLTSTSFKVNSTLTGTLLKFATATGSLARFTTLSGSTVFARNNLFSSGSLMVENNITSSGSLTVENGVTAQTLTLSSTVSGATISLAKNTNRILSVTGALVWYVDGTLATGNQQSITWTMPFNFRPNSVKMNVKTAPTGAAIIVNIKEGGTTIFGTKPQINASSTTQASNEVFSDTSLAKNSIITLDIDQVGSTVAGEGLSVMLMGTFDM